MIGAHPTYGAAHPSLRALINLRSTVLTALIALLLFSCRKDEEFTSDSGAKLTLTEDTVLFDTIFTTVGSVTKRFTVRNDNDQAVRVNITLEGGTPSPFRINVDGASGMYDSRFSLNEILLADFYVLMLLINTTLWPLSGTTTQTIHQSRLLRS